MKNLIVIIMLSAFAILGLNAQEIANKIETQTVKTIKGKDKYSIKVDGLGCPFCAYGLEKKFKDFKGIKNVKIEMETGVFTFTYPAEKALSIEQVEAKVEEAGYTAITTKIIRTDGTVEENATTTATTTVEDAEGEVISKAIQIWGNCGMCKARIEKITNGIEGVIFAEWSEETKILMVQYDSATTDSAVIEAAVAKAGHDTENAEADDETYENLPACCLYDRK